MLYMLFEITRLFSQLSLAYQALDFINVERWSLFYDLFCSFEIIIVLG